MKPHRYNFVPDQYLKSYLTDQTKRRSTSIFGLARRNEFLARCKSICIVLGLVLVTLGSVVIAQHLEAYFVAL